MRSQEGEISKEGGSPGEQVSQVPLKGLAGKADETVAQNLDKGERLSLEQCATSVAHLPVSPVLCAS